MTEFLKCSIFILMLILYATIEIVCYSFLIDVPNSGRGEKTEDDPKGYPPKINSGERQKFDELFRNYIKKLEEKKPVIVTGDLNVSHKEIG